ncbi:sulfatase-like hydrolase/transferase [Puniceicoccales bacterium CK1056]|uniref:Sulfatase-like hydrolase/transferase n=1 Tax=Oceanipulchritudo coccoides TaxID=2706888 RepID=A0A6B2M4I4_9BACT|nr:sulfatase-like hydrolase/transferase [Oceanipulchritudo coccoides]NDV63192.1 sulfatase-like hydrolase/transferase [Oceanipulchritudo coccoides]
MAGFLLVLIQILSVQALYSSSARLTLEPTDSGSPVDLSHLLGTNLALWYEPVDLAKPGFQKYLEKWSPGLIRLPGGSWSNEYYWNGNGVRTGKNTFNHEAFKNGRWEVDYSGYAPGFRIHGTSQELSDYHGVIDVRTQHELAESLGADQMVTVNVGTGTPEMAAEWLKWTIEQGYSVPNWEIGNELNGQWEVGHFLPDGTGMTGEIYAQKFIEYAKALKAIDPSIKVGGPASSDLSLAFIEELIRDAGEYVDFVTFHAYPVGVQRTDTAEKFKDIDLLRDALAKLRGWKKQYQPDRYKEIEIGITEWNMKVNEDRDTADLINSLWSATWIGAMLEGEVTLSNQWDLLTRTPEGGHGAFFPKADELIPTSLFWAQYIWGHYMGDRLAAHSLAGGEDLEVFTTQSETGLQVMLINKSETAPASVELNLPETIELSGEGRLITFSRQEYFWDPHHHEPLWSLPPTVTAFSPEATRTIEVPAFSIRVVELPYKGSQPSAVPTVETDGEPELRLVIPETAPADLPLEVWIVAWDTTNERPYSGELGPVALKLEGSVDAEAEELFLKQSVAKTFIEVNSPGALKLSASSGDLAVSGTVLLEAVESRPSVLWTFDNPISEWGATATFEIGMEPSVKPNEFVAEAILDGATPGNNADVLMLLEKFPDSLPLDRIGGVVGEMQASPDFKCDDPGAQVNIVLQSEADHWMLIGSIPLEAMRGEWKHYSIEISDPMRLKAMARLYGVRFQIQSKKPVSGEIYFDNLGFLLREAPAKKKNVLFIAVDDLKPAIGAYGEGLHTPAMDRLAAQGTTFLNAHCQQAVCGPSRASLLTGMRPDYTRVWDLKTQIRDIRPEIVTLPQYFKENGYETAGVGKIFDPRSVDNEVDGVSWSLPFGKTWELDFNTEYGQPAAHYQDPQTKKWAKEAEASGEAGWWVVNKYLKDRDAWLPYESEDVPDNAYEDGAIADRGVQWIKELGSGEKPFFIAVGFKKPHLPFVAPKKYWELYDREAIELAAFQKRAKGSPNYAYHTFPELRSYSGIPAKGPLDEAMQRTLIHGYYACVSYIDAQVEKLMQALQEAGVADDTIIVLWGDHGFHLGDHGLWCKHTNYEQATRAPLMFAGPGVGEASVNNSPVEFVDIFPTLAELSGLPVPDHLQGTSLGSILDGTKPEVKAFAVSQYPRGDKMGYALRSGRFRYVAWFEVAKGEIPVGSEPALAEELFDYELDPLESVNIIDEASYAGIAEKFRTALKRFLIEQAVDNRS